MTELREELRKAREVVQLVKEAAEAEKQVAYTLGVEETKARLTKELSVVCRDYYDISWGEAFDVAGVPVDYDLRQPKSIYYDLEIRKLSGPDSFHLGQATQVSTQLKADQVPSTSLEVPKDSNQDGGQGKGTETLKARIKVKIRRKPTEKALDTVVSQPGQTADPAISKTKA